MGRRSVQYCLRLPPALYKDAVDLALVFDLSLNRFLAAAIEKYVASQLQQESTKRAIERVREARSAGLVSALGDAEPPEQDSDIHFDSA
jgi:hypothetical protein